MLDLESKLDAAIEAVSVVSFSLNGRFISHCALLHSVGSGHLQIEESIARVYPAVSVCRQSQRQMPTKFNRTWMRAIALICARALQTTHHPSRVPLEQQPEIGCFISIIDDGCTNLHFAAQHLNYSCQSWSGSRLAGWLAGSGTGTVGLVSGVQPGLHLVFAAPRGRRGQVQTNGKQPPAAAFLGQ